MAVWLARLERFGYTLTVVERSKEKAKAAMSKEYIETYFKYNHEDRDAHKFPWYVKSNTIEEMMEEDEEFQDGYKTAMDEINYDKMEYGVVEWL